MNPQEATTQAVLDYLSSAPGSLFAGQQVRVLDHWVGAENLLWRVETVDAAGDRTDAAAKLYLDAGWVRGRRQHDAHTLFAERGLAPQPLWFDREPEGLARQIVLYRFVEGSAPASLDPAAMDALADAVAALHGSDAPLGRMAPHPLTPATFAELLEASVQQAQHWSAESGAQDVAATLDALGDASRTALAKAIPLWQGLAPFPVHGDLKLENVVATGAGITLIDWELCGLGDPALDVARFLTFTEFAAEEQRERWLERYLAHSPAGMAARIALYRALLPFDALCRMIDGVRIYAAELDQGDRADLAILLEALFARAGQALGLTQIEARGLDALMRQTDATGHLSALAKENR